MPPADWCSNRTLWVAAGPAHQGRCSDCGRTLPVHALLVRGRYVWVLPWHQARIYWVR